MDAKTIINYVMNTPQNSNPAVLKSMLGELDSGGSSESDFYLIKIESTAYENAGSITIFNHLDSKGYEGIVTLKTDSDTGIQSLTIDFSETPLSEEIQNKISQWFTALYPPEIFQLILDYYNHPVN